jgi:replicative DNA helicase
MDRIEGVILSNLVTNEEYARRVLPFLQGDYFRERPDRVVFDCINKYFQKYNRSPSKTALIVDIDSTEVRQAEMELINNVLGEIKDAPLDDGMWLLTQTEKFCRDRAVYNAIYKSIEILDGKSKKLSQDAIPSILQEAISVSFDKSVGHDFSADAEKRYDFYHKNETKIPFHLDIFNKMTKGGLLPKTLNCILAPTGVGKSLFLCDHAANVIKTGRNALYITLEMAEERIAERIDCNTFSVGIDDLAKMSKKDFLGQFDALKEKSYGRLIIKEYPTASAHAGHFRALLDELKLKQDFTPDVIYVDYLNICASQRLKNNGAVNSYTLVKAIAEELRAMAIEYNVPILTATQTNREGANNSEIAITDVSESFGLPMTLDLFFALIRTPELDAINQIMVVQLKSRYADINALRKFVIGVEIDKFYLYEVEQSAQNNIIDDGPVFDSSKFGTEQKKRGEYLPLDFD